VSIKIACFGRSGKFWRMKLRGVSAALLPAPTSSELACRLGGSAAGPCAWDQNAKAACRTPGATGAWERPGAAALDGSKSRISLRVTANLVDLEALAGLPLDIQIALADWRPRQDSNL
jgi:hypothetical protein